MNKRDMIGRTRWPEGLFDMPPRAGLINNVDKFDADYFGFTESEAQSMNPLLRHMFEVCYECVVDSGLPVESLQNNTTGMYTACFLPGHDGLEISRWANSKYCTTVDQITGHVMRYLKLSGPMATVDTACSSALSALEMAVTDLQLGRCQYALVAGCNLLLNPSYIQMMMKLGMLNPTGQSNVFDADAGGYVRAEGIVAILLTRQERLCKRIYASVVDIITGCDGFKEEGITFPSAKSQTEMIKMLYKRAGVDVNNVAYMEAHSTGTKAGDPVEVSAIAESLCKERTEPLLVGSVKANMGHSEATAALASLMKCLLAARHGVIPPQINYNTTNPKLTSVAEGKVVIVNKPTKLPDGYIGLNSFGFGGANGHLILKPHVQSSKKEDIYPMVVPVTARTDKELANISSFVRQNFQNSSQLALLADSVLSHDCNRPIRGFFVTDPKRKGRENNKSKFYSIHDEITGKW
ncbi:hypothetical protein FSP39_003881 [Pinctada imbricata]|uniref:Fatty acid synthase n=1 Tax=Pinctada imbricata TaxID=66713 RepID=A0AA89BWS8_PINIB|nr:hypothetical protein FSP39_003881 [Pinctada imbricata]